MTRRCFTALTLDDIADRILKARSQVVYAAPGLTDAIAAALIHAAGRLRPSQVKVVLDPSPKTCRLGFGQIEALEHLQKAGLAVGEAVGLRIGCVCVDGEGWIFAPTPLLIETGPRSQATPNAVRAEAEQVARLVEAVAPEPLPLTPVEPEIGTAPITPNQIKETQQSLEANPPRQFDISRLENVFNAAIEFVEIKLTGLQIQRRTVRLPAELLMAIGDEDVGSRLEATYRLIGGESELAGTKLRERLDKLRERYLADTSGYGKVILRAKRPDFEKKVEALQDAVAEHQEMVRERLDKEIKNSREKLVTWLTPGVLKSPPASLFARVSTPEVNEAQVRSYLEHEVEKAVPQSATIVGAMKLECRFKAVTYDTLKNEAFRAEVLKKFPHAGLQQLMDEYEAVRMDRPPDHPAKVTN